MKDCSKPPPASSILQQTTAPTTNAVHTIVSRVDIVAASRKATHKSTTASVVTNTEEEPPSSEAITSVFHSWSNNDEDGDKNNNNNSEEGVLLSMDELQRRLKRRLSPEDFPTTPCLKRRKRPTCCFINYMTSSSMTMQPKPASTGDPSTDTTIAASTSPLSLSTDSSCWMISSNTEPKNHRLAISPTPPDISLDAEELSEEQLDLLASFDDNYFSPDLGHATLWG